MVIHTNKLNKNSPKSYLAAAFSLLVMGIVVVILIKPPIDPDLGWHLRNGKDILQFGAPVGDLYSHTMFGYPWVSHEWLTDAGLAAVTENVGLWILPWLFAVMVALAYWLVATIEAEISLEAASLSTLIAALVAFPIVGVRAQMITLLGLALVWRILLLWQRKPNSKIIYWLIPIFLLWVNLHGGFVAGLFLLGLFIVIEILKIYLVKYRHNFRPKIILSWQDIVKLIWVSTISLLATLVNPYTWRIYEEFYRTVFNSTVRQGISEWMPVVFNNVNSNNLVIYLALLLGLLILSWRKTDITKIVIGIIFILLALTSWRNLPLASLVTLPLLAEIIQSILIKKTRNISNSLYMWIAIVILGIFVGYKQYNSVWPGIRMPAMSGGYPYNAVQYIKNNQLQGQLFNEYNWGGYLVWQLPEKQVFIDGRMAIWRTPTQDIFKDYVAIGNNAENAGKLLKQYNIGLALVFNNRQSKGYFLAHPDEWELLYQDNMAMLFQRHDLVSGTFNEPSIY